MADQIFPSTLRKQSRRTALFALCGSVSLSAASQDEQIPDDRKLKLPTLDDDDKKLPDGKSQKNAIAKAQHEAALKDADTLVATAQELRDELRKAGSYVVPVASVKKNGGHREIGKAHTRPVEVVRQLVNMRSYRTC